ncbi:hypothetical protein ACFSCV_15695 [Methylopila henanensis]|uniref:Right-handed parallel beta-helix repeat-containing protein n=1 Tax=Methylopila henanensis TaxID=873516 RepID=A0ABW4KBK4_9HYPH
MAVAKTASGGEVSVLDPMALGVVTITKPMTIISSTERGGILASGTTGVIVNVAAGVDVYLEGLTIQGGGTGVAGIRMTGQGTLHIRNSIIRGFTGAAVSVEGGGGTRVFIDGLSASGNGFGVRIAGKSGAANSALVRNSAIVGNSTAAVQVENNGTLFVGSSSLVSSGGGSDIVTLGSGKVFSYGDNVVGNGNPTGLRPLK